MSDGQTENTDSHQKDEVTESSLSGEEIRNRDPDIASQQPGKKQNPSNQSKRKWWQFSSQGIFNFLIVFIYACQAYIMSGQWSAMKAQLVEMRSGSADTKTVAEAAKESADAAQKNVATAQAALKATIENSRLDQRAWLGIASHNMSPKPPDTTNPIFISTVIKNTGKTPAKKVWAYSGTTTSLEHEQRQPDFSQDRDKTRSRGIVPPGGEVHSEVSLGRDAQGNRIPPNQEIIDDLKNNRVRMYVHGFVSYQDIFNKCHWLTFCFYLATPDLSSFLLCEDYNDTGDEQCKEEYPQ